MIFIIRVGQYLLWFFVNFVFCLLPITVYLLINKSTSQMFSSFLSFNYTLLIVSFYLCYNSFKRIKDEEILSGYILFPTLFLIFIIYILFWTYNGLRTRDIPLIRHMDSNIWMYFLIVFILSLFFSLLLNRPLIKENIDRDINKWRNKKQRKTSKHVQDIKDQLEREGT